MKRRTPTVWVGIALAGILAGGCEGSGTSPAASTSASAPAASAAAAPAPELVMDPEVKKLFEAIVKSCEINESGGGIDSCPNNESQALFEHARDKKPPHAMETLAELAVTTGAKDKKVLSAAITMMRWMSADLERDWLKQNATPAAADRILKLVVSVPDDYDLVFPDAGVGVPIVAGRVADLDAAIQKRAADSRMKRSLYQKFVQFGGAAVLPQLAALTKSPDEKLRHAATFAVSVAMYRPTFSQEEQTKICDWARGYLNHEDPSVSSGAADAMTRCKGAYIDAALDELEARIRKGPLSHYGWASLAHHLCWAEGVVGGAINGSPEQCKRALSLSDQALQNAELKGEPRRLVVFGIQYIARNAGLNQEGKAILQKYVADADPAAAEQARQGVAQL